MTTVYVTDGGWNRFAAPKLCAFLRAQPGLKVVDDYEAHKLAGKFPAIDVCVCTSTNAGGQGENTDARIEALALERGIPLVLVETELGMKIGIGPKAALEIEYHSFGREAETYPESVPPSFKRILEFIENQETR